MPKFQTQGTKPSHLAGVMCIPSLIIVMSSSHIITNTKKIQEDLGISQQTTSWIMNIDTIMQLLLVAIVGKLGEKYGSTLILTIGMGIASIFNLCFAIKQIATNFILVILFRALAAIGLGLAAPCVMPVTYQLVLPGKIQVVVSFASLIVPLGAMASSFSAGFIAQSIGWQFMCVIIGGLALINFVCCIVFLPFRRTINRAVRINIFSVLILGIGLVSFILGLLMISQVDKTPDFVKYIMIGAGLGLIVMFFVYDYKFSKAKIFSNNLINRSVIVTEALVMICNLSQYGERYLIPSNLAVNFKITAEQIGICMAINSLSSLIFAPLVSVLYSKIVAKYVFLGSLICYLVVLIFNILQLMLFPNLYLYVTLNFFSMGFFICISVLTTSFNFAQCPQIYSQQIGVLNQLICSMGNSIGITSAVVISQLVDKKSSRTSIATADLTYACFIIIAIILTASLFGMLKSEKDKKGYSEIQMKRTRGFDDQTTNDELLNKPEVYEQEKKGVDVKEEKTKERDELVIAMDLLNDD
ncbi:Major_facilitator superfamily protein [Hexamita inflata]|uniref:Major_facilitator superfamily protein n=1 Tax=Hexamita inflata TaxID=28002 RepID=A0ABP1HCB9_9EUKA